MMDARYPPFGASPIDQSLVTKVRKSNFLVGELTKSASSLQSAAGLWREKRGSTCVSRSKRNEEFETNFLCGLCENKEFKRTAEPQNIFIPYFALKYDNKATTRRSYHKPSSYTPVTCYFLQSIYICFF